MRVHAARADSPLFTPAAFPLRQGFGGQVFTAMETWSGSDERRRARRKSEPGGRADEVVEFAGANHLNRLRREQVRGDGSAVAKGAQPVTEDAMVGRRLRGSSEAGVVVGVLMRYRRRKLIGVVGRVPPAQRTRQDEDD